MVAITRSIPTHLLVLLTVIVVISTACSFSWSSFSVCRINRGRRQMFTRSSPDRDNFQLEWHSSRSSSTLARYLVVAGVDELDDDHREDACDDGDVDATRATLGPFRKKATVTTTTSLLCEIALPQEPAPASSNGTGEDESEHHEHRLERRRHISKVQWKKKAYLLIQDVKTEIRLRPKHAPRKAEEMVRRMRNLCEHSQSLERSDGSIGYGTETDDHDFIDSSRDGLDPYQKQTLVQAYNLWIHALAKSGWEDAGFLAEDVLDEMRYYQVPPNAVSYSSVMDAHARSPSRNGGAKAAQDFLLGILQQEGGAAGNINSLTFDAILNAFAQEGTVESAEQAELILYRLEGLHDIDSNAPNSAIRPTRISYATVMNAWAKVGTFEAAERAEALLDHLLKRAADADARRKSIPKTKRKKRYNGRQEEEGVVRPDTVIFNAAINCWATSRHNRAGHKSLKLLEKMKSMVRNENENGDDDLYDIHPDIVTYNTVLSAWSHCGNMNAAPKAEKIVKEMEREHEQYKQKQSDPSSAAMSRVRPPVVPNTVSYNTILDAWSKSQMTIAASRAQKVLDYMILSGKPEIAPDVYSFTSVMDAWAKSKEGHKGARTRLLLDRLINLYQETRRLNLRPTQIPYNTVLNACAFSAKGTSDEEQREALKIAVETFASMSTSTTTTSSSSDTSTVRRDTVSYGNMLKCIANLVPQGEVRNRMALNVFQQCCEEGLVGCLVWNEIRRAVPSKLIHESFISDMHRSSNNVKHELNVGSIEVHQLPKHWTANNRFDKKLRAGSSKQQQEQKQQRSKKGQDRQLRRKIDSSPSPSSQANPTQESFIVEPSFASDKDM